MRGRVLRHGASGVACTWIGASVTWASCGLAYLLHAVAVVVLDGFVAVVSLIVLKHRIPLKADI